MVRIPSRRVTTFARKLAADRNVRSEGARWEPAGRAGRLWEVVSALLLIVVVMIPTLVAGAVLGLGRLWQRSTERPRNDLIVPAGPPIERIALDLRRLNAQRDELRNQAPAPGRWVRAQALDGAYADVLVAACRALDVVPPELTPAGTASAGEILRAEQELRQCGLDVSGDRTP